MLLATVTQLCELDPGYCQYKGLFEVYGIITEYYPKDLILKVTELRRLKRPDTNEPILNIKLAEELQFTNYYGILVQLNGYWIDQGDFSAFDISIIKDPKIFEDTTFCNGILNTVYMNFVSYYNNNGLG